jgi:hypothetical protein
MFRLLVVLLAGLVGCKSAEDHAGETALAYASTPGWQPDLSWPMVCTNDQAAKSLVELQAGVAALEKQFPEIYAKGKELEAARQFRIQSVTMGADQTDATVVIEVKAPDKVGSETIAVRLDGDKWCVATGWAEEKRLEGIAEKAEAVIEEVDPLMDDWKFDEAKAKLDEAEAVLVEIPAEHDAGTSARISLETQRSLLELRSANWLGGRWTGSLEKDPMTDATNAVASLESVDGLPNSIGRLEKARIILRCQKGKFEAYVNAGTMLDSNWRYDTVSGQHRFDGENAQKLVGGVSTSRDAVFLRSPKQWAASFKEKDGSKWLVELPVYNRTPQTVTFDLTASTKAVDMVLGACGG